MILLSNIFFSEKTSLTKSTYEELFKLWYAPLCKLIFKILKDKAITEDTVQEVYIKLWEKRDEIKIQISLKSYLYRAAINSAYNHLQKNKRYPKLSLSDPELENRATTQNLESLDAKALEDKINQTLLLLPEACREVFILSRWEQLSYKEIASTLGISIKTVENQMGKALKLFRIHLVEYTK